MKRRPSKYKWKSEKAQWGEDQKLQAVATYVMTGNLKEVCLVTSIPYDTLKWWKEKDWWKELVLQIRDEDVQALDSNLQRVIGKALSTLEDRLDKGDYQYDPKTGKPVRIPIKAHIALKATTELLTKQDKIRDKPKQKELENTIDARLLKLAEEFSKFSKARTIDVISNNQPKISLEQETVQEPVHSSGTTAVLNLSTLEGVTISET